VTRVLPVSADVARLYDEKADAYDDHFRRKVDRVEDRVLYGWLRPHLTGRRVLDVGCGTGALLQHAAPARYTGIDISEQMVRRARIKSMGYQGARFAVGDWCDTGQPRVGGGYDTAVCLWAFSYMTDPFLAAARMFEAVREGGTVVIHAYTARYPKREHYVLNGAADALVTTFSPDELRAVARHVGLHVCDLRGFRHFLDTPIPEATPTWLGALAVRAESKLLPPSAAGTLVMTCRRPW
jgi:SAM-dependent methyltransferase